MIENSLARSAFDNHTYTEYKPDYIDPLRHREPIQSNLRSSANRASEVTENPYDTISSRSISPYQRNGVGNYGNGPSDSLYENTPYRTNSPPKTNGVGPYGNKPSNDQYDTPYRSKTPYQPNGVGTYGDNPYGKKPPPNVTLREPTPQRGGHRYGNGECTCLTKNRRNLRTFDCYNDRMGPDIRYNSNNGPDYRSSKSSPVPYKPQAANYDWNQSRVDPVTHWNEYKGSNVGIYRGSVDYKLTENNNLGMRHWDSNFVDDTVYARRYYCRKHQCRRSEDIAVSEDAHQSQLLYAAPPPPKKKSKTQNTQTQKKDEKEPEKKPASPKPNTPPTSESPKPKTPPKSESPKPIILLKSESSKPKTPPKLDSPKPKTPPKSPPKPDSPKPTTSQAEIPKTQRSFKENAVAQKTVAPVIFNKYSYRSESVTPERKSRTQKTPPPKQIVQTPIPEYTNSVKPEEATINTDKCAPLPVIIPTSSNKNQSPVQKSKTPDNPKQKPDTNYYLPPLQDDRRPEQETITPRAVQPEMRHVKQPVKEPVKSDSNAQLPVIIPTLPNRNYSPVEKPNTPDRTKEKQPEINYYLPSKQDDLRPKHEAISPRNVKPENNTMEYPERKQSLTYIPPIIGGGYPSNQQRHPHISQDPPRPYVPPLEQDPPRSYSPPITQDPPRSYAPPVTQDPPSNQHAQPRPPMMQDPTTNQERQPWPYAPPTVQEAPSYQQMSYPYPQQPQATTAQVPDRMKTFTQERKNRLPPEVNACLEAYYKAHVSCSSAPILPGMRGD